MGDADGALRFVDVLTASAGGAIGVDFQIAGVQVKVDLLHLGEYGYGCGGGVDAPAGLRDRDALDPVAAGLKFEP